MTDPKETDKPVVQTRTPRKKVTTGIFDNLRKLPERHPVEEILGLPPEQADGTGSTPSSGSTPGRGSTETTPSTPSRRQSKSAISPDRDYMKVANSISREAVPSGLFGESGGKSKQLYDYLYSQTRGAVVPRRKVRIPKDKLMRKAGIGSEVTLRKNLARLRTAKLVKEMIVTGAHGGNEYEVFLPEEVGLTGATPSTPSTPSTESSSRQMQEGVEAVEATASIASPSLDEATSSGEDKTSSLRPQRTIDDDAALALLRQLQQAERELTGKTGDPEKWKEPLEVILTELRIAAARTPLVSSAPSLLAEHLRRRLFKKDKAQIESEGSEATTTSPPKLQLTNEQISKCPDCGGSGMYYPEGYEKGVAKCRHEELKREGN